MTIREYYKLNKEASKSIFKILGVVFTGIFATIFLIFAIDNKRELIDGFYLFILCFVLGNFLGLTFFSFVFAMGYSQVKSQIQLFSKIPTEIKDSLELRLLYRPLTSKYSFAELDIVGYNDNSFINFDYDRNDRLVWITIRNIMNDIEDFYAKKQEIDKKYKKDSVFLSGWGLKKEIKWKHWEKLSEEGVKEQIIQLYRISEIENLRVEKMYYKIS